MSTRKHHSPAEIAVKLAEAEALVAIGMRRQQVALTLGVSVMTYNRWRKANPGHRHLRSIISPHVAAPESPEPLRLARIADLERENSYLRKLVTDLLLEKMKLLERALPARQLDEADNSVLSPH